MSKKTKKCFVVCPIGSEGSDERKRSDVVLNHIISPVMKDLGYEVIRADKLSQSGRITVQIFELLATAEVVVGDLSDLNPNAMYEMGFRLALNKPFVHMAIEGTRLPFDASDFRAIFYRIDDLAKAEAAKNELKKQVEHIEEGNWISGVPLEYLETDQSTQGNAEKQMLLSMKSSISELIQSVEETKNMAYLAANYSERVLNDKQAEREARTQEAMLNLFGGMLQEGMKNPDALKTLMELGQSSDQDQSEDSSTDDDDVESTKDLPRSKRKRKKK